MKLFCFFSVSKSCAVSFLSLHQQIHQSTPLPGVQFLSVFSPLPNQSDIHPSPIHLSISPHRPDPFIHGSQRNSRGDKTGEDIDQESKGRRGMEYWKRTKRTKRQWMESFVDSTVCEDMRGGDSRRETV